MAQHARSRLVLLFFVMTLGLVCAEAPLPSVVESDQTDCVNRLKQAVAVRIDFLIAAHRRGNLTYHRVLVDNPAAIRALVGNIRVARLQDGHTFSFIGLDLDFFDAKGRITKLAFRDTELICISDSLDFEQEIWLRDAGFYQAVCALLASHGYKFE